MVARRLRDEMGHVQQVTERLRGSLNHVEGQAELGAQERAALNARRAALDQEANMMREGFAAHERQLATVQQHMAQCEARNAAESRELAAMYQECRALPTRIPPHLLVDGHLSMAHLSIR